MPPGDIAPVAAISVIAVCTAVVLIFRGPLGRSLGRWIDTWGGGSPRQEPGAAGGAVDPVRMEELEHRVLELEERLDFAERLLAQQGEPARLREPRP